MKFSLVQSLLGAAFFAGQASAVDLTDKFPNPCDGPDNGADTTVVTIAAHEGVDVFHRRAKPLASVIEFCVREVGNGWTLVASHGTEQNQWSLLQSWTYPKVTQIKTRAYANRDGILYPFEHQTRMKTAYGYSFSWFESASNELSDQIVYCYRTGTECPTSRRVDFP